MSKGNKNYPITQELSVLIHKTHKFANKIGQICKDTGENTPEMYQLRYLISMCKGSIISSKSYWILRRENRFIDSKTIARSLLDRIVNARTASSNTRTSIELLAYELSDQINRMDMWNPSLNSHQSNLQNRLQEMRHNLAQLESHLPDEKYKNKWNFFNRFQKANLEILYRTAYFHLTKFVHGDYTSALEETNNPRAFDHLALLAPIDTALQLSIVSTLKTSGSVENEYKALLTKIGLHCFPNK